MAQPHSCHAEPEHSRNLGLSCHINDPFLKIYGLKAGAASYLGSHDAEAHAVVLLQGYRDNLWLLPHWLEERDRRRLETEQRGVATVWCTAVEMIKEGG